MKKIMKKNSKDLYYDAFSGLKKTTKVSLKRRNKFVLIPDQVNALTYFKTSNNNLIVIKVVTEKEYKKRFEFTIDNFEDLNIPPYKNYNKTVIVVPAREDFQKEMFVAENIKLVIKIIPKNKYWTQHLRHQDVFFEPINDLNYKHRHLKN